MLDFYEGELLRRTVLVRNALRRAASEGSSSDAQLFFGAGSVGHESPNDDALDEHHSSSAEDSHGQASARVQVSDYDYDDWEDTDESEAEESGDEGLAATATEAKVVHSERVWFDDLFDEVSVEHGGKVKASIPTNPVQRPVHPADRQTSESHHQPCPSLIDDDGEGSSTDESSDDDEDQHPEQLQRVLLLRTPAVEKKQEIVSLDYSGGADLSLSTSRQAKSPPKASYHDRIHNSRHSLSTARPSVVSY